MYRLHIRTHARTQWSVHDWRTFTVPSVRHAKRVTAAVRAVGLPLPPANIRAVVFPLVRVAYLLEPRPDSNTVLTFSIVDGDGDLQFETNPPWYAWLSLLPSLSLSLPPSFSLDLSSACPSACFSSFGRYCAFEDASLRVSYLSSWRKLRQTAYFFGDYSGSCSHGEDEIEDLIVSILFNWSRWIVICPLLWMLFIVYLYVISYISSSFSYKSYSQVLILY